MTPVAVAGFAARRYKHRMTTTRASDDALMVALPDLAATRSLAARLAALVVPGDVIALAGDLGAGKTEFARAFINALARRHGQPAEEVPSPTFTLAQSYDFPPFTVWHFDLYRIKRPDEAWELGIEDAFADGVSLIEWPDRLGGLLPADALRITLLPADTPDARRAEIAATAGWAARLAGVADHG